MLTIASNKSPSSAFAISIPLDPSPTEKFAAEELAEYVRQITGVTMALEKAPSTVPMQRKIRIETTPGYGESEYRITVREDKVKISGGKRGVLFGVYDLLERFGGVGWFSSWHTVVPRATTFALPGAMDDFQKPAFELREDFWFDAFDGDYAARNRLDGDAMRFEERHGGRSSFRFGGGLGNAHTFHILMPPEEFYDSHPEYYSLVDGKRLRKNYQLCLSNPEVLRIVTERVKKRIEQDPGARYFGVSQEDNSNYCRCEACAKIDSEEQSPAGTLVRFVNAVAADIEKSHPDVIISTLAYLYSRKPPAKTRLRKNVMVVLCTSGCEFSKSFRDSTAGGNLAFCEDLKAWSRQTDRLYIWDYNTNFRHFQMPFPNVKVLRENFRFFRDNKVVSMFAEGAYIGSHASFAELKAYLSAKWLWNPDLELEPLLDRFMHGYYGKAAPAVRRYFDEVEALPKPWLGIAMEVDSEWLSDAFLERADRLWREAEELVKGDAGYEYNVRMGRLPVVYTRFMRRLKRAEKSIWLCTSPKVFVGYGEAAGELEWIRARMREAYKPISFSEYEPLQATVARWEKFMNTSFPERGAERAEFGVGGLKFSDPSQGHGTVVSAPGAKDGKAYCITNNHSAWCVVKGFEDIAFDATTNYLFRFRVKVQKTAAAEKHPDLQAFTAGVYDENIRRNTGLTLRMSEVKDGWQWYEIQLQRPLPQRGAYFWFAPGDCGRGQNKEMRHPAFDCIWFDRLEITKTGVRL